MDGLIPSAQHAVFVGLGAYILEAVGLNPLVSASSLQKTFCPLASNELKSCSDDLSHLKMLSPKAIMLLIVSKPLIDIADRTIRNKLSSLTGRNLTYLPDPIKVCIFIGMFPYISKQNEHYSLSCVIQVFATVITGTLGVVLAHSMAEALHS